MDANSQSSSSAKAATVVQKQWLEESVRAEGDEPEVDESSDLQGKEKLIRNERSVTNWLNY